ncbi:hypothetical protein OIU79_006583 [Salix purpurea]|uniref:Uncharacterized protein n=1 Tax=Salix purpurea TaxID=77065 RepID=A0A9Q0TVT6_SALPP|nr:hypothetical protein OIU79_006583 [Salix purpurea]
MRHLCQQSTKDPFSLLLGSVACSIFNPFVLQQLKHLKSWDCSIRTAEAVLRSFSDHFLSVFLSLAHFKMGLNFLPHFPI